MRLKVSDAYRQLLEKADWSHAHGRNIAHINADDTALARLYAYGYRSQTIGAFQACQEALKSLLQAEASLSEDLSPALQRLKELIDLAILPVPADFRALLFTLYYYHQKILETLSALESASVLRNSGEIEQIKVRFARNMERIAAGNSIFTAKDNVLPEQASFKVPNLQISIVPLIYGDHHSWNSAHVPPESIGATTHRHHQGVEIHLGFSPLYGKTILGDYCAELREGYLMPIPAMVDHGFDNLADHAHLVPFVFGSMTLSGWGIFFDVEPRPKSSLDLPSVPLESAEMNRSIYIERELQRLARARKPRREILIPAAATASGQAGALELGIAKVGREGLNLTGQTYRILSVRLGQAEIQIGPATAELEAHDHVGIPGGLEARLVPKGADPVVFLEAVIGPAPGAKLNGLVV